METFKQASLFPAPRKEKPTLAAKADRYAESNRECAQIILAQGETPYTGAGSLATQWARMVEARG